MQQVSRGFSIPVYLVSKSAEGDFQYSQNDTVQKLQKWIADNQGIPVEQQRLSVTFGNRLCPNTRVIEANPGDLLTRHIPKGASYISVCIRLRGVRSI